MYDDLPIQVVDRRKRGYFTVDNIFLDKYGKLMGPHGIAVYIALARFANEEQECWPSRRAIYERTGVSLPQVTRELNKLVSYNLVTIAPQYNAETGEQTSSLYTLLDVPETPLIRVITGPLSPREPALIRVITKQSPKKKDIHPPKKKEKVVSYRPPADIDPLAR